MANKTEIRAGVETLRSLAFGSIGAGYAAVGTGFLNPARIMVLSNITDVTLTFSMDGTNDHFVLPSKGFLVLDLTSNKTSDSGLFFKQGTIIYVKQTAGGPAEGSAYASIVFGE